MRFDSLLYPQAVYQPSAQHCAFGLLSMGMIGEKTQFAGSQMEQIVAYEAWNDSFAKRFPTHAEFQTVLTRSYLASVQKFTGIYDPIRLLVKSERSEAQALLFCNALPFCPQLVMRIRGPSYETELHNAALAQLGLGLVCASFGATKVIFEKYGIDTQYLPEVNIDKNHLTANAKIPFGEYAIRLRPQRFDCMPLVQKRTVRNPDAFFCFSNRNASLTVNNGYFHGEVTGNNAQQRSEMAFAIIELLTNQCAALLGLGKYALETVR